MSEKRTYRVQAVLPTTTVPLLNCGVVTEWLMAHDVEPVPVRAVLDTGSNRTAVSPRVASILDLDYVGTVDVDVAMEKPVDTDVYYGACFVFGDITVGPRRVHVVDLVSGDDESKNIDVLIGLDIISMGRLTVEPAGKDHYRYEFSMEV